MGAAKRLIGSVKFQADDKNLMSTFNFSLHSSKYPLPLLSRTSGSILEYSLVPLSVQWMRMIVFEEFLEPHVSFSTNRTVHEIQCSSSACCFPMRETEKLSFINCRPQSPTSAVMRKIARLSSPLLPLKTSR